MEMLERGDWDGLAPLLQRAVHGALQRHGATMQHDQREDAEGDALMRLVKYLPGWLVKGRPKGHRLFSWVSRIAETAAYESKKRWLMRVKRETTFTDMRPA